MHFCVKILYLVKIHTIIDHMKRREFVYKVALGAAASALPAGKTLFADTKEKAGLPPAYFSKTLEAYKFDAIDIS